MATALTRNGASAPGAADLLTLARSRDLGDQQRLLRGVAALCEAAPPQAGDPAHQILGDIFLTLAEKAERDIRRTLAECLAKAEWAPPALINTLALDEIEIARPVIAASPLLKDQELLKILVECTIEHQIEVARRPRISGRVADAILDAGEPAVMTALAANRTAEIGEPGVRRLVEASQRIAALRAPLVRHPAMNDQLAQQLYARPFQNGSASTRPRWTAPSTRRSAPLMCARAKRPRRLLRMTPPATRWSGVWWPRWTQPDNCGPVI